VIQCFRYVSEIRTIAENPDPIQIRARCGPDTMVIRRPIHGMIRRSVPVRAVKTRRRFGSENASFQVSVPCFLIEYLILFYMSAFNWFLYTSLCLNSVHV